MFEGMAEKRQRLLEEIREEAHLTRHYTGRDCFSERVMRAMYDVPRHKFVPLALRQSAYDNHPLPIGQGQTISQPYIVALMTDLLDIDKDHVVLEIGTGSGYQAAVLSLLARRVYTLEVLPELALKARERLAGLGYTNVEVESGDGYAGWPEHAPYDGIMVTAAAPYIPPALIEQLRSGGRMVIPLGEPGYTQELVLVTKDKRGRVARRNVLPVAFVPLVGVKTD